MVARDNDGGDESDNLLLCARSAVAVSAYHVDQERWGFYIINSVCLKLASSHDNIFGGQGWWEYCVCATLDGCIRSSLRLITFRKSSLLLLLFLRPIAAPAADKVKVNCYSVFELTHPSNIREFRPGVAMDSVGGYE